MIVPAIGRRVRIPIRMRGAEPTIREMLSDAIVIAVMQADHVDPAALEADLRGLAHRQAD